MAKRRSQAEHDRLVKHVAELLSSRGYKDVQADLDGYNKTQGIMWQASQTGFFPDVSGVKDGKLRIFEAETEDSIEDEHTHTQWKLFASFAKDNDALFYIVFQKGAVAKVKARMKELNIEALLLEV